MLHRDQLPLGTETGRSIKCCKGDAGENSVEKTESGTMENRKSKRYNTKTCGKKKGKRVQQPWGTGTTVAVVVESIYRLPTCRNHKKD